jgi:hypothetical protein
MPTQYQITVQAIRSKGCNPRLYVYVPLPLAAAIGLEPGEKVEWDLIDRGTLQMKRSAPPPRMAKKSRQKSEKKETS